MPFEIPESWEWVRLDDVAQSNIGLTYSPSEITNDGIPVLRSCNIKNQKLYWEDLVRVNSNILEKQYLNDGDLLICARNGSRHLVGKCALITNIQEPISFGAFMAVCRSQFNRWIYYLLHTTYFDRYLDDSNSTTINQVTQKMLLDFQIPLPPAVEQQRIVAEVEKWFALIDELEVNKEELKEYIKQVKSKVLDLAIHGKLVPQDPNDEPAIELLKRINPNFKPCDTSHYENLPQGWTVSNLLDICKISTGKWDANHAKENGKYRFYTCASKHAYSDTKRFFGECLIVPGNGDIGAVYYFDGDFDAYQRTYVLDNVKIYAQYLYYHFLSNWRQLNDDKKFGSTIKFVRIGNFQDYKVLIPPYEEQKRIVAYLNNLFTIIESISAEL